MADAGMRFDNMGRMVCEPCGVASDNAELASIRAQDYGGNSGMSTYRLVRIAITFSLLFASLALRMCSSHHHY